MKAFHCFVFLCGVLLATDGITQISGRTFFFCFGLGLLRILFFFVR